jgi:serine/threonine-protein kinase
VHDFGISSLLPDQQVPYIVMELVEGEPLADHLASGAIDWRIAVRVCAEVGAALAAAHAHGIIHRDVKPANIMLTPAGVKVLDFGIAATAGQPDSHHGVVLGTPAYAAPERFDGVPATPATDMYSLGVLLYHCLAGRLPWPEVDGIRLLHARRHRDPDPLPAIEGLAPEVVDLCSRCLARDPAERPTSLVAALLLAEAVDARVYVPMVVPTPRPRSATISPWDERAATALTDAVRADVVRAADGVPAPGIRRHDGDRVGRHRA